MGVTPHHLTLTSGPRSREKHIPPPRATESGLQWLLLLRKYNKEALPPRHCPLWSNYSTFQHEGRKRTLCPKRSHRRDTGKRRGLGALRCHCHEKVGIFLPHHRITGPSIVHKREVCTAFGPGDSNLEEHLKRLQMSVPRAHLETKVLASHRMMPGPPVMLW